MAAPGDHGGGGGGVSEAIRDGQRIKKCLHEKAKKGVSNSHCSLRAHGGVRASACWSWSMGTRFGEPGRASRLPLNGYASFLKLLLTSHCVYLCKGYGTV